VKRLHKTIVSVAVGLLLLELIVLAGFNVCVSNRADAAQRFTPETVKSVPESFLKGGDRTLKSLAELNTSSRENGRKLDKIADKLDQLNANLTRLLQEQ